MAPRRFVTRRRQSTGMSLPELTLAAFILMTATLLVTPPLLQATMRLRLDLACQELVGVLRLARAEAIKRNVKVGLKFLIDARGGVSFTLHRDGDGDGLLSVDIRRGIDPAIGPARRLAHVGGDVHLGFPAGRPPRDPGDPRHRLDHLEDPVRFNRSDIAAFDPFGTATPGTLYVTDGRDQLIAIRVLGTSARVRQLHWDARRDRWLE
jgi:hypothetical protein